MTTTKQTEYTTDYQKLRVALKQVLDSNDFSGVGNTTKACVLLDLENGGEYDPLN